MRDDAGRPGVRTSSGAPLRAVGAPRRAPLGWLPSVHPGCGFGRRCKSMLNSPRSSRVSPVRFSLKPSEYGVRILTEIHDAGYNDATALKRIENAVRKSVHEQPPVRLVKER